MRWKLRDSVAATYSLPQIVAFYASQTDLQEAEHLLFEKYVHPGSAVLDVGVGAGRTTPFLASRAGLYIGVDSSEGMLRECRRRFPQFMFLRLDASDMSSLIGASFDVVVFSFNGIDALPTMEARRRCLQECNRLLKPGGVLIFSSHHARYMLFVPVVDSNISLLRAVWRCAYAGIHTLSNVLFRVPRRAFWKGAGYVRGPFTQHGGLRTYATTPEQVTHEVSVSGFKMVTKVNAQYPRETWPLTTPWYYYACVKDGAPTQ